MAHLYIFPVALLVLFSWTLPCGGTPIDKVDPEVCLTPTCQESAEYLKGFIDTSVDPCEDFYRYACGGWIEKHPLPEDQVVNSPYIALNTEVIETAIELLKNVTTENHPRSVLDTAHLFQGCIDEEAREAQGVEPLKKILNSFGGWPMINPEWSDVGYQWYTQIAKLRRALGADIIIGFTVMLDKSDGSNYIPYIGPADYGVDEEYLKNMTASKVNRAVVKAYRDYIISVAKLLNPNIDETALANDADEIIQFESKLVQANYSVGDFVTIDPWYQEMMSDIVQKLIKGPLIRGMPVSEVQELTENKYFKWTDYLNIILQDFPQVTDETNIIPYSQLYLTYAINLAHETDPRIVANYIGWSTVMKLGGHTTKVFRDLETKFTRMVKDNSEPPELEQICVKETIDLLDFGVGRLYVDKFVHEGAKEDLERLVEDIRSAYEVDFIHNEWMDPDTKDRALEKLRAMISLVGYPDWMKDDNELDNYYSGIQGVKKDEYFESYVKVKGAKEAKLLMKWNQRKQRATEWQDPPTTVNAFYYPTYNVIMLPAAIFNLPFYKYGRLPALNLGAVGSFVAHEIGHGFDDTGSKYDKEGNPVNWWSKETKVKFEEKVGCYKRQYSSYVEPTTNLNLNGNQTIGDDIADNSGIRHSFMAYRLQVLQAAENEVIGKRKLPGISATPEQLFYIAFATTYCEIRTAEAMSNQIENDEHSPEEYRVLVPLGNTRAFSEVFNCPLGSRMNPVSKCQMW